MSLRTEIGFFPLPGAIVISCSISQLQLDGTSEINVVSTDGALNLDRGSPYISSLVDNPTSTSINLLITTGSETNVWRA